MALLSGVLSARAADYVVSTFDSGIPNWYGLTALLAFDGTQDNTLNGGGSCKVSIDFNQTQNLMFAGMYGPGDWGATPVLDLTVFQWLDLDIRWDDSSTMRLADFNNPPGGGTPISVMSIEPGTFTPNATIGTFAIPAGATSGWAHVSIWIDPTIPGLWSSQGLWFNKWIATTGAGTAGFWIDNVKLRGLCCVPPPPPLSPPRPDWIEPDREQRQSLRSAESQDRARFRILFVAWQRGFPGDLLFHTRFARGGNE
ncbi:MAG: hypothetical protein U1F98_16950 [Verrucomicrobiota bacterium]